MRDNEKDNSTFFVKQSIDELTLSIAAVAIILGALFGGTPDIADGIIAWLSDGKQPAWTQE